MIKNKMCEFKADVFGQWPTANNHDGIRHYKQTQVQ